jgi:hypothetical protein
MPLSNPQGKFIVMGWRISEKGRKIYAGLSGLRLNRSYDMKIQQ